MRKSYIQKIFINMLNITVVILVVLGVGIIAYTKAIMEREIIELNQSVLNQVTFNTATMLSDVLNLCDELSFDSEILEEMTQGDNKAELQDYVETTINEKLWKNYKKGSAFQVFFSGRSGWLYPEKSPYGHSYMEYLYQKAEGEKSQGPLLATWDFEEHEKGLYRYTFQVIQEPQQS